MTACDTGFFVECLKANPEAVAVLSSTRDLVVSVISLYEIQRLALKGGIDLEQANKLLEIIPTAFEVIYLDEDSASLIARSARLGHGNGLSMADSLIFAAAMSVNADLLYTTDSDMSRYKGSEGPKVVML